MAANEAQDAREARKTRRVIRLWILAGSVFALTVLGYSATMVFLAQRDYPGSVVNNYFENYQRFNAFQKELDKQQSLDWQIRTRMADLPIQGQPVAVNVRARDALDRKLSGARVFLHFVSGDDSRQDRRIRLRETKEGLYSGRVRLPSPGNWEVITRVERGGDAFRVSRYLWVEEPLG